jgi:alpha-N-arabinofuranosidase
MSNIGRETFLLPVRWENGWPMVLEDGQIVPRVAARPALPRDGAVSTPLTGSFVWSDDFDAPSLSPIWNFLRTPRQQWYSLTTKPGSLLFEPRAVDLNSKQNPSLIARRQQHHEFSATTSIRLHAATGDCDTGLVAFQNQTHYLLLAIRIDRRGELEVFLERSAGKNSEGGPELVTRAVLPRSAGRMQLKIEGRGRTYAFSYRADEQRWAVLAGEIDASILSTEVAGGFVGSYIGMFARSRR